MRHPAQLLNVSHFRQRCMMARPDTPIPPYYSNRQIAFVLFARGGPPGETRTPGLLVRSYAVQNSKCRFWCRLQGNAPFVPLLNWTEVGLKCFEPEIPLTLELKERAGHDAPSVAEQLKHAAAALDRFEREWS
jgi:hypothetical protein